jgi:phosphoserine phosphatase
MIWGTQKRDFRLTLVLHGRQLVSFRRPKEMPSRKQERRLHGSSGWIFSGFFGMFVMLLISPAGRVKAVTWLYLTRHGQTEWNVENRFQGSSDSPLTEKGVRQAEYLAERLRGISFDAVYSSPAGRALRTAEILCGDRDVAIRELPDLREMELGDWEGMRSEEIEVRFPEEFDRYWRKPHLYRRERGESYIDVQRRVVSSMGEILRSHPGGNVLIVTHTVVLKTLMAHFEGRPLDRLWDPPYIHPACLNLVRVGEGKREILLHGDIAHFPEEWRARA